MGDLYDRIKTTIKRLRPPKLPAEVEEEELDWEGEEEAIPSIAMPKAGYLQEAEASAIIRKAARNQVLIYLLYNGVFRYVEPYSFRQGKEGLLFFGHDLARNDTRSYYISRMEEVSLTDIPFSPRWYIEID